MRRELLEDLRFFVGEDLGLEIDLETEKARQERLTSEVLKKFFTDSRFSRILGTMRKRLMETGAEGGFIAYKKKSGGSFYITKRWGMPSAYEVGAERTLGFRSLANAHIYLDDIKEELENFDPNLSGRLVRIGDCHFHPFRPIFSPDDLADFNQRILGTPDETDGLLPVLYDSFRLLGTLGRDKEQIELLGISLPQGRLLGSSYQESETFQSQGKQIEALRACGFKVVRTLIPIVRGRAKLGLENIEALSSLGS